VAAEGGEMRAAVNLGLLYLDGLGTEVDYAEALRWTELAAEAGQPIALNNLGHIYENGLGVPANRQTAIDYYQRSADQGYELAADNLARLVGDPPQGGGGKTKTK
jgi:uncharacterized protein